MLWTTDESGEPCQIHGKWYRAEDVEALLLQRAQEIEKPIDRDAWREFYSQSARLSAENAEHWRERAEKAEAAIDAALDGNEATRVLKARISELNDQLTARAQEIAELLSNGRNDMAPKDYRQATAEERAMARGFVTLWESVGVQDAEDWLYVLRNRAELLASLDEDDSREAQDNTPSLGPFKA